jgi:hypothetical protein
MNGIMDVIDLDRDEITPEAREKEGASGVPVMLADGRTWLLCDGGLCNALDGLRDEIDDQARLRGAVDITLIRGAAFTMLRSNYLLSDAEAADLILGAEVQPLTDAVSIAFFGDPDGRQTFTVWAAASFLANNIDPANVPYHLRQHVLDILVQTHRTIPASKFIESAIAAPRYREFRAKLAEAKARDEPKAKAEAAANPPAPPPIEPSAEATR